VRNCDVCKARIELLEKDLLRLRERMGIGPAEAAEEDLREAVAHTRRTGGRDFTLINAVLERQIAGRQGGGGQHENVEL